MNIALFVDTYFPQLNGVATVVSQLKKDFNSLGHKVWVLTPKRPNSPEAEGIYYLKARPSLVGKNEYLATEDYKNVVHFCLEKKIDILHVHSEFSVALIAIKVAKKIKIPFVITFHTFWEHYIDAYVPCSFLVPKAIVHIWIRHVYKHADRIFAVSQKVFDYLSSPKMLPQKDIQLIENAVDNSSLQDHEFSQAEADALKQRLGITTGKILLYVGRVSHEKRLKELLKIFQSVLAKIQEPLYLIIVGDGPAKDNIMDFAKDLNLSDSVKFMGFVQREVLGLYFTIADLFVSASVSETYSMTVTESLTFQVPCILRDDACYYDRITNEQNGLMLKNDNEFEKALVRLIQNPEELTKLKESTKASVKTLSSIDQSKKYLAAYEEVIERLNQDG